MGGISEANLVASPISPPNPLDLRPWLNFSDHRTGDIGGQLMVFESHLISQCAAGVCLRADRSPDLSANSWHSPLQSNFIESDRLAEQLLRCSVVARISPALRGRCAQHAIRRRDVFRSPFCCMLSSKQALSLSNAEFFGDLPQNAFAMRSRVALVLSESSQLLVMLRA